MNALRTALLGAALASLPVASPAQAPAQAPSAPAASAKAAAPTAPATAPATTSAEKFSGKASDCKDFMALPADVRGLAVAWIAGRYHTNKARDNWMFDVENARKVVATVEAECEKAPGASFRYKVQAAVARKR